MGPHPDDPRMDAIWDRCAKLGLPINLHMSDPIWSYEKQDYHNEGFMNGFTWRLDDKPGILGHEGLMKSLESTLEKHPKTIFICTHSRTWTTTWVDWAACWTAIPICILTTPRGLPRRR